jgi:hypothetical protein
MPQGIEAPASTMAEGQTSHTQNQGLALLYGLDADQIEMLRESIDPRRIGKDGKGFSHLEAWDVRRRLIQIFGFGGWSFDVKSTELASHVADEKKGRNGTYTAHTVVYRVVGRLTVRNRSGVYLTHFDDGAAGDATNFPSLGDAHDMALKTAMSQALKRCAVNMGDQFGLSLYDDGSIQPVVATAAERYRAAALKVWDNADALVQVYGDVKRAGALEAKVPGHDGQGSVVLGEWIVARGKELRQAGQGGDTERSAA